MDPTVRRSEWVTLRLTPAEADALCLAALRQRKSVTALIRDHLRRTGLFEAKAA